MEHKDLCEQYIKKVKRLFPYIGKSEKDYLNNLRLTLDEYCTSEDVSSLPALEEGFGKAEDLVHNYYYSIDTDELVKRLNTRRIIRIASFILIAIIAAAAIFYSVHIYKEYQLLKQNTIFMEEIIIE
ncbi:MAG: hypothetical protein IJM53_01450 [Lachnospiraceae bacterium]|nr:hypothetical protein [Lachnospiraceae bacterium]